MTQGRVLIVAGSDSGGGAGIQADIKAVTALQGYAATAVTALTAQNTQGVEGIHGVPEAFIRDQMRVVLDDIGADAVKTGMLHSTAVVEAVCETLDAHAPGVPLIADPVMVAQSGDRLLVEEAVAAIREALIPRSALVTPNIPEATVLTGREIQSVADMEAAALALLEHGPRAVLVKGGHLGGTTVTDVLVTAEGVRHFVHPRVETTSNHGTGCTLASAIAAGIAQGLTMESAVARGRVYLQRALETAAPLGHGHGPVNHAHTVAPFEVGEPR